MEKGAFLFFQTHLLLFSREKRKSYGLGKWWQSCYFWENYSLHELCYCVLSFFFLKQLLLSVTTSDSRSLRTVLLGNTASNHIWQHHRVTSSCKPGRFCLYRGPWELKWWILKLFEAKIRYLINSLKCLRTISFRERSAWMWPFNQYASLQTYLSLTRFACQPCIPPIAEAFSD